MQYRIIEKSTNAAKRSRADFSVKREVSIMADKNQIDIEKTGKFAERVFGHLAGALVSGMIHLGERLGLYQAMNGAGPLTSEELARKTGLNERWVREWLYQQAAAG